MDIWTGGLQDMDMRGIESGHFLFVTGWGCWTPGADTRVLGSYNDTSEMAGISVCFRSWGTEASDIKHR